MTLVLEDLTDAQIEAIRALIDKEKQKPVQKWEPKGGNFYIDLLCNSVQYAPYQVPEHGLNGAAYQTEEQAQHALKSIRAHARQLAWLAENDDGWVADWNSANQTKFYVCHNHKEDTYVRDGAWSCKHMGSIYMSEQNAGKLVKLLNDGIVEF